MHPGDDLPTDLTRTVSKPHLHDFGSASEESIRVGDYLYEIYGSEPEKSPLPPARPYLQNVCPVQIYRNVHTACHYRKSHARKGLSAAEAPLGCAEASTDDASCGGYGAVSTHPGGRAAFSVQRPSPLRHLALKAAYAAASEQRARTASGAAPSSSPTAARPVREPPPVHDPEPPGFPGSTGPAGSVGSDGPLGPSGSSGSSARASSKVWATCWSSAKRSSPYSHAAY